jgi:hypothetical protein
MNVHPAQEVWTYYAFGGGLGHVTRALSLARVAARHGIGSRILSNSPFLTGLLNPRVQHVVRLDPLIEIVPFSSALDRDELSRSSLAELSRLRTDNALIVDTFPRGLAGELADVLPDIPAFKVLVHRDLNPAYVRQMQLEQVVGNFDLVIVPGEDAPLEEFAHLRTDAWMICEREELLTRRDARLALGVAGGDDRPLAVVVGSGRTEEALSAARLAEKLASELAHRACVRFASLDEAALSAAGPIGRSVWPLLALLPGVDLLIGAGGYHTVYEARATQTPLLGLAQPRVYDRQSKRLSAAEIVGDEAEILSRASRICDGDFNGSEGRSIDYRNGALDAFSQIKSHTVRRSISAD